jgi:hypothetical protein
MHKIGKNENNMAESRDPETTSKRVQERIWERKVLHRFGRGGC